jgi:hypothetical protein
MRGFWRVAKQRIMLDNQVPNCNIFFLFYSLKSQGDFGSVNDIFQEDNPPAVERRHRADVQFIQRHLGDVFQRFGD